MLSCEIQTTANALFFSSLRNADSKWTFWPQHNAGVPMVYIGIYVHDAQAFAYLTFSDEASASRNMSAPSMFLSVTTHPGKATLFKIASPDEGHTVSLMTLSVSHGALFIGHSGPEGSNTCIQKDIRAGKQADGIWATWANLGTWMAKQSMFRMEVA